MARVLFPYLFSGELVSLMMDLQKVAKLSVNLEFIEWPGVLGKEEFVICFCVLFFKFRNFERRTFQKPRKLIRSQVTF